MYGTLFGVGVGPGAPDLLTLRAVRVLQSADVILAATSATKDDSLALSIVREYVSASIPLVRLDFPMTRDANLRKKAWQEAAQKALALLCAGKNAAFVTIGDPLIYSTFGYLLRTVRSLAPECPIEVVSGITSFQAAAARTSTILCEDEESLLIVSGIQKEEALLAHLEEADTAVIVKAYRNAQAIREALVKSRRGASATIASLVERDGESLSNDLDSLTNPPYMTLVLSPNPKRS